VVKKDTMRDSTIQNKIRTWFSKNKRSLPWRGEKNWYFIWISEVMLQQTQVETVIPYYHKFIKRFNNVEQLAKASQEEVLKVWEGLGYYSRARNLHRAAKIIIEEHKSRLPTNREEILKIPGFGPYTTNAVLSLAFNQPFGVVDGNVKRVLSRLFAIEDDIRELKTQGTIQQIIDNLLPLKFPGDFNEAMMELGATICTPTSPLCSVCPLSTDCQARKKKLEGILPYKSNRPMIPTRQSLACIVSHQNRWLIVKRPQHEMLAGLWEFPVLKLNNRKKTSDHHLFSIRNQFNLETSFKKSLPEIKHTYTHFHLKLHSKMFESTSRDFQSDYYEQYQWLKMDDIKKLPLHKAMWKVLHKLEKELEIITQRDIINT
jgi:A/G-specific adenine glycosylase